MAKRDAALPHKTLDLLVLRCLARGANHGYGILAHIHEVSQNLLRVEEGSLYPALHRLEQAGLLSAQWRASANNRQAKFYSLTRKGRRQLADEQRKWARANEGIARVMKYA